MVYMVCYSTMITQTEPLYVTVWLTSSQEAPCWQHWSLKHWNIYWLVKDAAQNLPGMYPLPAPPPAILPGNPSTFSQFSHYLMSVAGNNMDGPWEHCAEWSKSDTERWILYALIHRWNLKVTKLLETENRSVVARWRQRKMGEVIKRYRLPV